MYTVFVKVFVNLFLFYPYGVWVVKSFMLNEGGIFHNLIFSHSANYATIYMLSHPIRQRKGGACMEIIISFFLSIVASIIAYYVCKWLDGEE